MWRERHDTRVLENHVYHSSKVNDKPLATFFLLSHRWNYVMSWPSFRSFVILVKYHLLSAVTCGF